MGDLEKVASPWMWSRQSIVVLGVVLGAVLVFGGAVAVAGASSPAAALARLVINVGVFALIFGWPYVRSYRRWRALHPAQDLHGTEPRGSGSRP